MAHSTENRTDTQADKTNRDAGQKAKI